jgi:hypothetical protein
MAGVRGVAVFPVNYFFFVGVILYEDYVTANSVYIYRPLESVQLGGGGVLEMPVYLTFYANRSAIARQCWVLEGNGKFCTGSDTYR